MNPVSMDWLLQGCQLHVKAAFSRLDINESLTNCSASSWCMEMSATSGLMFHTAWQNVVLSSVIAEISPGMFIPIFTLLQTVTLTLSQHAYTEWNLFSSLFHWVPSTDQNHILCLLHQLLQSINKVKKNTNGPWSCQMYQAPKENETCLYSFYRKDCALMS